MLPPIKCPTLHPQRSPPRHPTHLHPRSRWFKVYRAQGYGHHLEAVSDSPPSKLTPRAKHPPKPYNYRVKGIYGIGARLPPPVQCPTLHPPNSPPSPNTRSIKSQGLRPHQSVGRGKRRWQRLWRLFTRWRKAGQPRHLVDVVDSDQ